MNCKSFQSLTPQEASEFLGELIIPVQYSDGLFLIGQDIVEVARRKGIYEKAKVITETELSEGNEELHAASRLDINNPIEQ